MWFVSKKKYNEMVAAKEKQEAIAEKAIHLNERVISNNERILQEMKSAQELNHRLQQKNEELVARCRELEKERDMWRKRAEEESAQAEVYREMLKSAEVE